MVKNVNIYSGIVITLSSSGIKVNFAVEKGQQVTH